jgi:hypothetical protein
MSNEYDSSNIQNTQNIEQRIDRVERKILSISDILAANDVLTKEVYIKEWGGHVVITAFTKAQQQAMRREATTPQGKLDSDALEKLMVLHGLREPLLSKDDVEALWQKNTAVVDEVLKAILQVNGLDPQEAKQTQAAFQG